MRSKCGQSSSHEVWGSSCLPQLPGDVTSPVCIYAPPSVIVFTWPLDCRSVPQAALLCRQSLDKAYSSYSISKQLCTLGHWGYLCQGHSLLSYRTDTLVGAPLGLFLSQLLLMLASLFWNHPVSFQACTLVTLVPKISSHLFWPLNLSAAPRSALPCFLS